MSIAKLEDIFGLYMRQPAHALVLSIDERSAKIGEPQIQVLDRTQPGLALKPGKCGTMTRNYARNGTITFFTALNILHGTVIGRCMQNHRHQEFIHSLNAAGCEVPPGKVIYAIVDNHGIYNHPKVMAGSSAPRRSSISRQSQAPGSATSRTSSPR